MSLRLLLVWVVGILVCGLAFSPERPKSESPQPSSLLQVCMNRLHRAGLQPETEDLALGLLFGRKGQLDKTITTEVRKAGMSHMLAVSGLHIGIIWGVLMLLFRPLLLLGFFFNWNEVRVHLVMHIAVVVLLWGYIALVGFPASAQRAGLMITFTQVSLLLHRNPWGWHNLWLAALVILVLDPTQLTQVGFQLSMLATVGILAFRPLITGSHAVLSLFWLTVSAQYFTFPLCAYYFHQVPLLGWVQGILVVPVLAFLIYGLLALLCFPMLWNGLVEFLSAWVLGVAHYVSSAEHFLVGGEVYWYPSWTEVFLMELVLVGMYVSAKMYFSQPKES